MNKDCASIKKEDFIIYNPSNYIYNLYIITLLNFHFIHMHFRKNICKKIFSDRIIIQEI